MKQIKSNDECIRKSMYISPQTVVMNVEISGLLQSGSSAGTGGQTPGDSGGNIGDGAKKSNLDSEESNTWDKLY